MSLHTYVSRTQGEYFFFRIEVEAEGLDRDPLIFELKMGKLWEKSG